MTTPGPSKAKLEKLNEQRRSRAAATKKVKGEEAEEGARPGKPETVTTSYVLPTTLLDDLQKTKFELQSEMGQRKKYNATAILRAALQHFLQMEMDDQIELVDRYSSR